MFAQKILSCQFATELVGAYYPYAAVAALIIGFIGAVSIGSVAWYSSRRPVGWDNKEKPDFIPDVKS